MDKTMENKNEDGSEFGSKYLKLIALQTKGYNVPVCIGVGKSIVRKLLDTYSVQPREYEVLVKSIQEEVKEKIGEKFEEKRYAIRSSAFVEDGSTYSHAGEFLTKLNISYEGIPDAVYDVIFDAQKKGSGTIENFFSCIIQEYIDPDLAGVMFTRDPFGNYTRIVEWKNGNGEGVVGGGEAQKISWACNVLPEQMPFTEFKKLVEEGIKIEREENFPQDIEWAIQNGEVYILQTRPITSITQEQYKAYLFLNTNLPSSDYFYNKTTISESFTGPVPLAREILEFLHRKEGAIHRAYLALSIRYTPRSIFKNFLNETYIDKEEEIKQFFPTHSYFGTQFLVPHFVSLKGFFTTCINMYALQKISPSSLSVFSIKIIHQMEYIKSIFHNNLSFEKWLEILDTAYADVYVINICAEKAYTDLNTILKKTPFTSLDILSSSIVTFELDEKILEGIRKDMTGNSLNISDEGLFVARSKKHSKFDSSKKVEVWWSTLFVATRTQIEKKIKYVRECEVWREYGRWLTVLCMSGLRTSLKQNEHSSLVESSLVYFATLEEMKGGIISEGELQKRKKIYDEQKFYTFPSVLSSISAQTGEEAYGVSGGEVEGRLVLPEGNVEKGSILLTDTLNPGLFKYFDRISGIVSRKGGILSHLAIVAREYGIPVVVNPHIHMNVIPGQVVRINGSTGEVAVV